MGVAEGLVTFVGKQGRSTYLEISSETGHIPVTVTHGSGYLADLLLNSRVRVQGVRVPIHSDVDGRIVSGLSATNVNDITILRVGGEVWQEFPSHTIGEITVTNLRESTVHLYGTVQSVKAGRSFLLADGTGEAEVECRQAVPEMTGTEIEALCGFHLRGTNRVFQCGFFRPFAGTNQALLPTLTRTEQIRWLTPAEAARQYPVKIRGVITFLRTGGGDIQDGTGGVFIWEMWRANPTNTVAQLKPGDFCEVEGVTSQGSFSPQIIPSKVTVLGPGEFPTPAHPGWDELIGGGLDAQWVEVRGVVLSATNRDMEIGMKGGRISCRASVSRSESLDSFLGAVLRVRGVVHVFHDSGRHINGVRIDIPSHMFVSVETPAPPDPFDVPLMRARELFTYNPDQSIFRRVKVSGQIIHEREGIDYIIDGSNGMRLVPTESGGAQVGDVVEAVGFLEIDSPFDNPMLTLRNAVLRKTGRMPLPAPEAVEGEAGLNREHDSTLVRLESRLLSEGQYRAGQVLEMQDGIRVYHATLDSSLGRLPPLRAGSLLEVTGVYAVSSDKSVPFELLLNSPGDIRVLELPSWWTARHAVVVVSGMALVVLLVLVWNGILRQQVGKRTRELSAEITERKRAENELVRARLQHLVEQERTRIARDLHDDLGSRITQIVLLNDLALQNRVPPEGAGAHAREISSAAQQVIQSLDETVWAVNPRNDNLPHVFNYLSEFATEFLRVANVRCRLDFPDHPPAQTISAEARHNLFLAIKEALNNAARHAKATEVWLRGATDEESLVFSIEDNGRGFSGLCDSPSADGLRNMRQRMESIGGRFKIESAPETGTKVTLSYFWPSADG